MNKDLTVVAPQIPAITFSADTMKVEELKNDFPVENIPADLSVQKNYDIVVAGCRAHQKGRTGIEKTHKELKGPYLGVGKQLDKAKNLMLEDLAPIESAWKAAKKAQDDKILIEQQRIEKEKQDAIDEITTKISWINGYGSRLIGKPSAEVKEAIDTLNAETFDWAGEMVESAKSVVSNVLVQLESLYNMQVENETAEAKAEEERRKREEERVKREAEEKKLSEERAIEQKRLDEDRAKIEAEKAELQAEKDKLLEEKDEAERERAEAKEKAERLEAEVKQAKIDEEARLKAEKIAEQERVEEEAKAKKDEADRLKQEKADKKKATALAKKQAKELEEQLDARRKETLNALVEILRNDKPDANIASDILGGIEDGSIPNLTFC